MKNKAPKYCYYRKGRWVYIPYVDGKLGKEIPLRHERKLIRHSDPMSWVWTAYENIVHQPVDTISWLINEYLKSDKFKSLGLRTQANYEHYATYLKAKKTRTGTFGDVAFEAVTPGVITKLKDSMSDTPTACKHRLQFLSAVYTWAQARDKCSKNPCRAADKSVRKSKPKTYVEDKDFYIALDDARERKSYLYPMMIIAYCCRARVGEISRHQRVKSVNLESGIRHSDILNDGIYIHRSKGSLPEVTLWSEFLREGYRAALEFSKYRDSKSKITRLDRDPFLIHNTDGTPINNYAFNSAWKRLIKSCLKSHPTFKSFSIHELKAKGIDDHKNHESGHKSEKAKAVYLRKIKRTESTK